MATTDIDKRASPSINAAKIVTSTFNVDQIRDLVALTASEASHGAAHTAGARLVLPKRHEHGLLVDGVKGEIEPGLRQLRGLRVLLQRLENVRRCGEYVLRVETDPRLQVFVFGHDA
jgi:hypothetical protein